MISEPDNLKIYKPTGNKIIPATKILNLYEQISKL